MTNKSFIETLNEIKECCTEHETNCRNCKYLRDYGTYYECGQIEIFNGLTAIPSHWDIEEIEKELKRYD